MWYFSGILIAGLVVIILFMQCDIDLTKATDIDFVETGILNILLTNSDPYWRDSTNIIILEIGVCLDSQWIKVNNRPLTINPLKFTNSETILIGTAEVPTGQYNRILVKTENWAGTDRQVVCSPKVYTFKSHLRIETSLSSDFIISLDNIIN